MGKPDPRPKVIARHKHTSKITSFSAKAWDTMQEKGFASNYVQVQNPAVSKELNKFVPEEIQSLMPGGKVIKHGKPDFETVSKETIAMPEVAKTPDEPTIKKTEEPKVTGRSQRFKQGQTSSATLKHKSQ